MTSRHFYKPVEGRERDACNVRHPIDGEMRYYGAFWTDDAFTFALVVANVLVQTEETDPNPPPDVGPEKMMMQRRVDARRPKMRIMQAPTVRS
jgi:hypothetical protein